MGEFVPSTEAKMGIAVSSDGTATVTSVSAAEGFQYEPSQDDPYRYMQGFGNRFASEAMYVKLPRIKLVLNLYQAWTFTDNPFCSPGSLPECGRNVPQRSPFDLYSEQLNGTTFISSRQSQLHVYVPIQIYWKYSRNTNIKGGCTVSAHLLRIGHWPPCHQTTTCRPASRP